MIVVIFIIQALVFAGLLWGSVKLVAPLCRANHIVTALVLGVVYSAITFALGPYGIGLAVTIAFWTIVAFTYDLSFGQTVMIVIIMFLAGILIGFAMAPLEGLISTPAEG